MHARTGLLAALACALSLPITALRAADPEIAPDVDTFHESLDPSVAVSGQLLAGLMYAGGTKVDVDALHVSFAARENGGVRGETLCIRLASRDGVYTARWNATLGEPVADRARLLVKTEERAELENYPTDRLVALASVGEDCDARDRVLLPTFWGREPDGSNRLTAYLNSDTSDAVAAARVRTGDGEATRKEDCTIIASSEPTTAFDTLCGLTLAAGDTPVAVAVLRQNFSTTLDPLLYRLR